MRTVTVLFCSIVFVSLIIQPAAAERDLLGASSQGESGPGIAAWFDPALTQRTTCVSAGETLTVYLAVEGLHAPLETLRYRVEAIAPALAFIDETFEAGAPVGGFHSGVTLSFAPPADASGRLLIQTLRFAVTSDCPFGCGIDGVQSVIAISHPDDDTWMNASALLSTGEEVTVYGHFSKICDDDGLPDLRVASFTSPDTAMYNEEISSGLELLIWNAGSDSTNGVIDVKLLLAGDTVTTSGEFLSKRTILQPLLPGDTLSVDLEDATVPVLEEAGRMYLLLVLDRLGLIIEEDESDNMIYHPVEIIPDPSIDTLCVYAEDFQEGAAGWSPVVLHGPGEYRLDYDPPCETEIPCGTNETGDPQTTCNAWVAYDPGTGAFPFASEEDRLAGNGVDIGIVSPDIPVPADAVFISIGFDVYRALPEANNVCFTWDVAFPPAWEWEGKGRFYYGEQGWSSVTFDVTNYAAAGADAMRIRLRGLEHFKEPWSGTHTVAPYFDNVSVNIVGPSGSGLDLAHFPRDCSLSDSDWDGVGDVVDACPYENAAPFDRDGDGCVDETAGSRNVEYQSRDTLRFWIHENGAPLILDGSDITETAAGVEAWNAVPGMDIFTEYMGTTDQRDARILDGVNTVTFSDPDYVFPIGVLAVGITTSFVEPSRFEERPVRPGEIIDADIIFNPMMTFTTPSNPHVEGTDIRSVATHEAGHLFGMSHSAVRTSTMFFVLPPGTEASTLETEDILAMQKAYAGDEAVSEASRLKGTVVDGLSGGPVPGAIVYAIEAAGGDTLGSEYTMADGSFGFVGLPAGDYYVAIHPLNGSSRIGYLQPANINWYVRANVVDVFVPEYWDAAESNDDDETAMTAVHVTAGSSTEISIMTNIDLVGPAVTFVSPTDGSEGVRIDAAIIVSFSEPIDLGTLQGNFSLRDTLTGEALGGNAASFNDDSTLAFIPAGFLNFDSVYELTLDTGLSDKFGNGLEAPAVYRFVTEPRPDVSISSLAPSRGVEGSVIVIAGYGFAELPEHNLVDFNGTGAAILEASPSRLIVEVPPGASSGSVTVTDISGGGTSNPLSFTILEGEEAARGYSVGTAALGSMPRGLTITPGGDLVFVATEDGYCAVAVDPGSPHYLSVRAFGVAGGMNSIDATPDGSRVYAVSGANEKIYSINAEPGAGGLDDLFVLNEIDAGTRPLGIVVGPDGYRAYVATWDNTVQVYDINPSSASFDMQIGEISTGVSSLKGAMAIDPAGNLLMMTSGEGKVVVHDIAADSPLAVIDAGIDPRDVTVDPAGDRAYVTDDNGMLSVISLGMLERVADITTGGALRGAAVTPGGSFLYAVNRELNFFDVIDLRHASPAFRSVVANIGLPVNPSDVEISPDGIYAYTICEHEMILEVTAVGTGPVLRTLAPAAGPAGTKVVVTGSGFSAGSAVTVSFNGIETVPEVCRDSLLVAAVPPGDFTGPVTVICRGVSGPDEVSNAAYFERLGSTPADGLRLAGTIEAAGLLGEAAAVAFGGDIALFCADAGTGPVLAALDTEVSSGGFHQLLGSCLLPSGTAADGILLTPCGDLAIVAHNGAGAPGEPGELLLIDTDRLSPGFMTLAGSIDVSAMTRGVTGACICPSGFSLIVAEAGDEGSAAEAVVHIFNRTMSGFEQSASLPAGAFDIERPCFHPSGMYCYLPVTDAAGPSILVLDTDAESPAYATVVTVLPLPGILTGPVPAGLAFTPSGDRCLVLTRDAGATERREILMLETSDPAAPAVTDAEPLGGSADGSDRIDVSPRGDKAIASVAGEGLFHLSIVSAGDTVAVVDLEPGAGPQAAAGFYAFDGSRYYTAVPAAGQFRVYDFSSAHTLEYVSGSGQSALAGEALPAPMRVRVVSSGSHPVEGVPVTFSVTGGTGTLSGSGSGSMTAATGEDGTAVATLILGPEIGTQNVSVNAQNLAGSPMVFSAEALSDPETLPLRFVEAVPLDSTAGVALTSAVRITFSRPVDPASVDSTVCWLTPDGEAVPVPAVIGFSDNDRRVSIMPRDDLEPLTGYTIGFSAGILDAAGGGLENPGTTSFHTDALPPIVLEAMSPPSGLRGMNVVLSGQGFVGEISGNTVIFNGSTAAVTGASQDRLTVVVPYELVPGNTPVRVEIPGQVSNTMTFRVLTADTTTIDEEVLQQVGTGSSTRGLAITPDGALMYAVSPSANSVVAIDILSLLPLAAIPVGENPFSVSIDPAGDFAYVTNLLGNTVSAINIKRYSPGFNTVVETMEVGLNPVDAIVTPDGNRLVVSNLGSMSLSVIDTDRSSETCHMVLATVGAGQTTRTMAITPDGALLYAGTNDGYLVVETVEFGVVKTVRSGSTTKSIAVTPDGALLVVLTTEGEVVIFDIAPGSPTEDQVVGRVGTGSTAKSIAVTPDGGLLYVVVEEIDAILVVRLDRVTSAGAISGAQETGLEMVRTTVIDTLVAGEDPAEIAFAPGGAEIAAISNAGDNTVSIYNRYNGAIGVALSGFSARKSGEGIELRWRTQVEEGISGFRVLRSEDVSFGYEEIEGGSIEAVGIPSLYTCGDATARPGRTYYYRLEAVGTGGQSQVFGPVEFRYAAMFSLSQNVPNPFNPSTRIRFTIPETAPVRLRIYDVAGRLIRTLVDGTLEAGHHEIKWDGTNGAGRRVASGVYFYRVSAGKHGMTRKMVLLR